MRSLNIFCFIASLAAFGCGDGGKSASNAGDPAAASTGPIKIDGSSTVFPITEAVAEEFGMKDKARVTIGVSGTGGGFKKFCAGEIDVTGASRYIKSSEQDLCSKGGIDYIELPVAYDGISVVVHKSNTWVDYLTVDELKALWEPAAQGKINNWNQVRASFPDKPISLFGPGVDSGTFDYFTKQIVGKSQSSRGDYAASEDDNVVVHGVSTDEGALGFFGYAYYIENQAKLKVVPIKAGEGEPVTPTMETIADGSYKPLSRPIFIYVGKTSSSRPEVNRFVEFYLNDGAPLAKEVGYIPLTAAAISEANARYASKTTGTAKAD